MKPSKKDWDVVIYHPAYVLAVFLVIAVVFCAPTPRSPAKAMEAAVRDSPCPGGIAIPAASEPGFWRCADSVRK